MLRRLIFSGVNQLKNRKYSSNSNLNSNKSLNTGSSLQEKPSFEECFITTSLFGSAIGGLGGFGIGAFAFDDPDQVFKLRTASGFLTGCVFGAGGMIFGGLWFVTVPMTTYYFFTQRKDYQID